MTSWSGESQAIRALVTSATSTLSATLLWDDFNQASSSLDSATRYVRPAIRSVRSERLSMGPDFMSRISRVLLLQILVPLEEGLGGLETIAETVEAIFVGRQTGIMFYDESELLDPDEDGSHYHRTLAIPYHFDRYRTASGAVAIGGIRSMQVVVDPCPFDGTLQAAYITGGTLALASNDDTSAAADVLVIAVSGTTVTYVTDGVVSTAHGLGSSGEVWLDTAGALTTTEPAGASGAVFKQIIGNIVDASTLVFTRGTPEAV